MKGMRTAVSIVSFAFAAQFAVAQTAESPGEATDPAEHSDRQLDVVYVTAQRREEKLSDVPISISALSEAQIERAQVRTVTDLSTVVPNIQINETIGNTYGPLISIRGISPSADTSLARDQPVGIYIDGVPVSKSTGAAFDTVDLERVEVLRGPQGTLYGKNTIGGAINLITQKPSGEFGGSALFGAGSYGALNSRVSVDLPETAGFSAKLALINRQEDGYYRNDALASNYGEEKVWAGRVDILWEPTDNFSALYAFDKSDSNGTPAQLALTEVTGVGPVAFINGLLAPYVVDGRTRTTSANSAYNSDFETSGHALTLEWQPGWGDLTLKSITARRTAYTNSQSDFDGSPIDLIRFTLINDYEQFTQEFQAIGTAGAFDYTFGLFYLDDEYDSYNPRWNFQFGGNDVFDISDRSGGSQSQAAYGQVAWKPAAFEDRLKLSVGARYSREEKEAVELFLANSTYAAAPTSPTSGVFERDADGNPVTRSGEPASGARPGAGGIGYTDLIPLENDGVWSRFDPEFNVLYKFTDDFSVYGRVATGFKSGGINDTAATNSAFLTAYDPEKLVSYEAGFKFATPDRVWQTSGAVYHSDYTDFQAGVFVPELVTTNIINAGEAKLTGFELEGAVQPLDNLSLNFGLGYVDARYSEFILPDGTDVTDTYVIPRSPEWNYRIGAMHEHDLGFGTLETSANYSWRSDQATTISNDPLSELPAYGLLSARIALTDIQLSNGTTLEVAAWGKNLTDEEYLVSAINLSILTVSQFGDPRTFGADLRIRF